MKKEKYDEITEEVIEKLNRLYLEDKLLWINIFQDNLEIDNDIIHEIKDQFICSHEYLMIQSFEFKGKIMYPGINFIEICKNKWSKNYYLNIYMNNIETEIRELKNNKFFDSIPSNNVSVHNEYLNLIMKPDEARAKLCMPNKEMIFGKRCGIGIKI